MKQIELIKAEIERLKAEQVQYSDIYGSVDDYARASMCEGMVSTLSHLLSFIESLEKEQPQCENCGEFNGTDCPYWKNMMRPEGCIHYKKEQPKGLDEAAEEYISGSTPEFGWTIENAFKAGAKWQKSQEFTHIEPFDNEKQAAVHYMEDCQEVDDFVRRKIDYIAERYFCAGAKWMKKKLID